MLQLVADKNGMPPPCAALRHRPGAAQQACAEELRACASVVMGIADDVSAAPGSSDGLVFHPTYDSTFAASFGRHYTVTFSRPSRRRR